MNHLLCTLFALTSFFGEPHANDPSGEFARVILAEKVNSFGRGPDNQASCTFYIDVGSALMAFTHQKYEEVRNTFNNSRKDVNERKKKLATQISDLEKSILQTEDAKLTERLVSEMLQLTREDDSLREPVYSPPAVVDGVFTRKGPLEGALLVVGSIRPHDPDGKDKSLPVGTAIVEGKLLRGDPKKGGQDSLLIQNGDTPILITGQVPQQPWPAGRRVRATGELQQVRPEGPMCLIIHARKVEFITK